VLGAAEGLSASVGTSKRPTRTRSRLITVRHACVTISVRRSEAHHIRSGSRRTKKETDHEGSHPGPCCIVTARWDRGASQRICFVSWSADLLDSARSFTSGLSAGLTIAKLARRPAPPRAPQVASEVGGPVHVAARKRHGHVKLMLWEKIVAARARHGVELVPETDTVGSGIRWTVP
jgi:hypothetical protein